MIHSCSHRSGGLVASFSAILLLGFSSVSLGQIKNELTERSFWKSSPNLEQVQASVANGNDPSELGRYAFDPLSWALIERAPEDVLMYLLEQPGNDVNKLTHDGRTYIFWAAYRDNIPFMNTLISKGAKTDIIDSHGYSLLNFSAVTGQTNIDLYDFIVAHGANPASEVNNAGANALLLVAPFLENTELVDYFERQGLGLTSVDESGANFFHYAAKGGNITFLSALLDRGFDANLLTLDGRNAGHYVAMGTRGKDNPVEAYHMMDSLGIDLTTPSKEGKTPLWYALQGEPSKETLDFLIGLGTEVNLSSDEGENALMVASYSHEPAVLELLMSNDIDINQTDDEGHSALSNAVRYNSPEAVSFLLDQGASVEPEANGGILLQGLATAFNRDSAAFHEKTKLLMARQFDLGSPQEDGNTLFHLAVNEENSGLCMVASQHGTDVNHLNSEGYSALHLAAMQAEDANIIEILLDLGAKTDALTPFEETPFDLAKENERLSSLPSILNLLQP